MAREIYEAHENFIAYQEEIATSDTYRGMPDLRYDDGSIQWEAPSNRSGGKFRDSHVKRLQWWKNKAESIGINTDTESQWISKTAKRIHPTNLHPCKFCGNYMDLRYCYFSNYLIRRVNKIPFIESNYKVTSLTNIFDFIPEFIELYGDLALKALPKLLKCKQFSVVPTHDSIEAWLHWVEEEYVPAEPSLLSPGAMSNAPDRLDGFHSFNRCCRSKADKGRSKENLASYGTDRRAFEHWVDGNWVAANKLMGIINSDIHLKQKYCLNAEMGGSHPRPCSADHIGPISLGFAHRPEFQLLCKPCNSAKNNRMYLSDVVNLQKAEKAGKQIASWYSKAIWTRLNERVVTADDALKLSRIMRDNRHNAMLLLYEFFKAKHVLFLYTFLNLECANFSYEVSEYEVHDHIVSAKFKLRPSELKYVLIQKARRVRVAFKSLIEYGSKDNRNVYIVDIDDNNMLKTKTINLLDSLGGEYEKYNLALGEVLFSKNISEDSLKNIISEIPLLDNLKVIKIAHNNVHAIIDNVSVTLSALWNDLRYSRETSELLDD